MALGKLTLLAAFFSGVNYLQAQCWQLPGPKGQFVCPQKIDISNDDLANEQQCFFKVGIMTPEQKQKAAQNPEEILNSPNSLPMGVALGPDNWLIANSTTFEGAIICQDGTWAYATAKMNAKFGIKLDFLVNPHLVFKRVTNLQSLAGDYSGLSLAFSPPVGGLTSLPFGGEFSYLKQNHTNNKQPATVFLYSLAIGFAPLMLEGPTRTMNLSLVANPANGPVVHQASKSFMVLNQFLAKMKIKKVSDNDAVIYSGSDNISGNDLQRNQASNTKVSYALQKNVEVRLPGKPPQTVLYPYRTFLKPTEIDAEYLLPASSNTAKRVLIKGLNERDAKHFKLMLSMRVIPDDGHPDMFTDLPMKMTFIIPHLSKLRIGEELNLELTEREGAGE